MGYALAEAAIRRGWEVDLVSGPVALATPVGVQRVSVNSAQDMYEACLERFDGCDVFVAVAAVADFRPKYRADQKQTKVETDSTLELEPTVDILKTLGSKRQPGQVGVGFAAETHDLEIKAPAKLAAKGCDWIVANDVSAPGVGMESDTNAVTLWNKAGQKSAKGPAPKAEIAEWLWTQILDDQL